MNFILVDLFELQVTEIWSCMSAHKNYVLLDLGLHKFKGHQESTND